MREGSFTLLLGELFAVVLAIKFLKFHVHNYIFVGTCRALGGNEPLCSQGTPGFSPPKIYNAPCIYSGDYTNYPLSSSPPSTSSSSSGPGSSSPSAGSSPTGGGTSPSSGAASYSSGGSAASANPSSGSGSPSSGTTAATPSSESSSPCLCSAHNSPKSEQLWLQALAVQLLLQLLQQCSLYVMGCGSGISPPPQKQQQRN